MPSLKCWTRRAIGMAACLAVSLGVTGCAGTTTVALRWDAKGKPIAFERRERDVEVDWIHHVTRHAYARPGFFFGYFLGKDQLNVLKADGKPEWIRKAFVSDDNERVKEWIYPSQRRMVQFIGKRLVYQGPLSDYARILWEKGYPDKIIVDVGDQERRSEVFIYSNAFSVDLQEFHFHDGKLAFSQEEGH